MKNWKYSTIAAILAVLLLSSCSTVPVAREMSKAGEGVYIIRLSAESREYYKEDVQKYAINQFVKSKGYDSYDFVMTNKPVFGRAYFEFTVTVPGSIPVEDMDEVRVVDGERTGKAIGWIIISPAIVAGLVILVMVAL
jgi:hypothetical protein